MHGPQWNSRKRERDFDDDERVEGFKTPDGSAPHRTSPKLTRYTSPPFITSCTSQPAPPTITPADSDSEVTPVTTEPKSFFSPYSSSPTHTVTPSSPYLDAISSSQSTQISDIALYSDDFEMTDSIHLSPGSFQNDPSTNISSRIPTPIHSSFAPHIRAEKAFRHSDPDFADDEAMVDRFRKGRRLPSPISEGEMSPSVIVEGLGEMQMEVEQDIAKVTPTKKGHSRSKHSLRNWTGLGGELNGNGASMKRSFTMGYRADCEKCRNRVPGHFSHIITY